MKKIKVAMITNHLEIMGISTVIMNYCKELDPLKFDLTIIAGVPVANKYDRECKKYGIKVIPLPSRHKTAFAHYLRLWKIMLCNDYDIVHIHGNSSMMAIELTLAKIAGTKIRIAHSHNSICPNIKMHKLLNKYFKKLYTQALSCGVLAGDWLFGRKQFTVLPNGFDTEKFVFHLSVREKIRKKLQLEDKFVIGHIGRLNQQKNQPYLLQIFEKVAKKRVDAYLILVGTGPDDNKIQELVNNHLYKERIILYGETTNPEEMYSAMDIFVFPSRFEGLPVVLLEAQISGLPCMVSDKVTKEIDFGDIIWKSIDDKPEIWAREIIKLKIQNDIRIRYFEEHQQQIKEYDIKRNVLQLEKLYMDLYQKKQDKKVKKGSI